MWIKPASNVSPIPNLGFKAGVSYENSRRFTASLFRGVRRPVGRLQCGESAAGLASHSQWKFALRLSKYLPFGDRAGIAAVVHANNLTNQAIWLPSGFSSVDTVPVSQGTQRLRRFGVCTRQELNEFHRTGDNLEIGRVPEIGKPGVRIKFEVRA
jgi:hypothetical protein